MKLRPPAGARQQAGIFLQELEELLIVSVCYRRADEHLLQRGLQAWNVPGPNVHHRVGAAGDRAGIHDLRDPGQDAQQLLRRDGSATEQLDVRLRAHAVDGRVHLDRKAPDHAVCDLDVLAERAEHGELRAIARDPPLTQRRQHVD